MRRHGVFVRERQEGGKRDEMARTPGGGPQTGNTRQKEPGAQPGSCLRKAGASHWGRELEVTWGECQAVGCGPSPSPVMNAQPPTFGENQELSWKRRPARWTRSSSPPRQQSWQLGADVASSSRRGGQRPQSRSDCGQHRSAHAGMPAAPQPSTSTGSLKASVRSEEQMRVLDNRSAERP